MVRVGIVGAGLRGRLFARALAGRAQVVGFAEPSKAAAEDAREAGFATYSDHRELLSEQRPDAVVIATPDFAHRQAALDAAHAGAHLLVEKPLATSVADAEAIAQAVRQAGVQCMVGFENRWSPHFVALAGAMADGRVGRPISQSITLSNTLHVPTQMLSWSASSSPIWFLQPHATDLAYWLSGAGPVSVFARGHRGVLAERGIDTWDVVHVSIGLDDGGLVDITSAWILPESAPSVADFSYQLISDKGSATVNLGDQGLSIAHRTYESVWPLDGAINGEPIGIAAWMVQRFVRDLEAGVDVSPGLDEGLRVTATLDAVEQSLQRGGEVAISERS